MSDDARQPMPLLPPPPQAPLRKPLWKRWWFWLVIVLVLVIIASVASGASKVGEEATKKEGTPSPQPTKTGIDRTPEPTKSPIHTASPQVSPQPTGNTFEDGTWIVGKDIRPGTYRAGDPGGSCYWERLKNFGGSFNSIITNGNALGGPIVVTIEKTDAGFSSEGCGQWSDDLSPITNSRNAFGDGIYIVGVDISPGTYRVVAGNGCYWERLRNFTGEFNGIIANDNTKGSTIVEIASSDAGFSSQDCGNWEKI